MSIFAKHNQLPSSIIIPYGEVILSGSNYAVLNDSSNINIQNSTIDGFIPSFNINNGIVNVTDTTVTGCLANTIVILNSKSYIDDLLYNNYQYTYVESGSVFNYSDVSYVLSSTFFEGNSQTELLIIPIDDQYKNSKLKYIREHALLTFGTGNEFYSTHFLNNGNYGYWGNKYGGEWISDATIDIYNYPDFYTFITTIPRNLNGYTLTINFTDTIENVDISNFYNGTLNINFKLNLGADELKEFTLLNNNLTLNFNFLDETCNFLFKVNDNRDLNITFSGDSSYHIFEGDNNYIHLNYITSLSGEFSVFNNNNSYGNKVAISTAFEPDLSYFARRLENNNAIFNNLITVLTVNKKIADLINDSSNNFDLENYSNHQSFIIDEVHPKKYRDVCDIGTIIGWNAYLPIPRGYYKCDGSLVKVDLNNPNDLFYNGQLAYYLNGNLSTSTIKLPNIPGAIPSCMTTDPRYYNNNFVPQDTKAGIIYIIKYNNNFENKKGKATTTPIITYVTPPITTPVLTIPEDEPTSGLTEVKPLPEIIAVGALFNYNAYDNFGGYTVCTLENNFYHQKIYKDYGGDFNRGCVVKIPRQTGDTTSGNKYILTGLTLQSEAHGHWVDPAAVTHTNLYFDGAVIDMSKGIIYNCTVRKQRLGVNPQTDETITYTENNGLPINGQNFIDIKVEQTQGGSKYCYRWSHTTAYASADNSYIYIVLSVLCHSDKGALQNDIWYANNNIGCQFYKNS